MTDYDALAKRCRLANLGYDDGNPGVPGDIEQRLDTLERNIRSYSQGNARLHAQLSAAASAPQERS